MQRMPWYQFGKLIVATLSDQVVVSGATFALNVLLARELAPRNYGAFAIAFAVLMFVAGLHNAIVVEPIAVVGPIRHRSDYLRYVGAVTRIHAGAAIAMAVLVSVVILSAPDTFALDPATILALGVATPFVLSFWFLRGCCYLFTRPRVALLGAVVYAATMAGTVLVAHLRGHMNSWTGLMSLGLAGATGGLTMFIGLGMNSLPIALASTRSVLRDHWQYGRWFLGGALAHGIAYGSYPPLLGAVASLEEAASLRAMQNLVLPLERMTSSVSMLTLPILTTQAMEQGTAHVRRIGAAMTAALAGGAMIYALAISQVSGSLLGLFYRNDFYREYSALLTWIAAGAVVATITQSLAVLLRAVNTPHLVLWSKLAAATVFLVVGIPLASHYGSMGAAVGLAGSAAVEVLVLAGVLYSVQSSPGSL